MLLNKKQNNKKYHGRNFLEKGFTLIELMIVIGIFSILTSVIVFNYAKFNSDILLTNMAYEVALDIREAQVFSLGVRSANTGSADDFNTRYGVYFDKAEGGNEKKFVFFADRDSSGNCDDGSGSSCSIEACTAGGGNECESISTLTRDSIFEEICVSDDGTTPMNFDTGVCTGTGVSKDTISITFARPNPDTLVSDGTNEYNTAAILMRSNQEDFKKAVHILSNGQISIKTVLINP